jgi:ADP-ribose pyrophosphatase
MINKGLNCMKFTTLKSETVYEGKAFDVKREQILLPGDKTTWFDLVIHPGAVTLIPIDSQERILFVRQYRHAVGKELLELPAGTLESGEDPGDCASREVREETGMSAGKLVKVGEFYLVPGYSTEYMFIYLASDLQPDPLPGDDDEFITVEAYPLDEVPGLIKEGKIQDAKSIAALALAQAYLDNYK